MHSLVRRGREETGRESGKEKAGDDGREGGTDGRSDGHTHTERQRRETDSQSVGQTDTEIYIRAVSTEVQKAFPHTD